MGLRALAYALLAGITFTSPVWGDFVQFNDSQAGGVTVAANGFINAPLTLNGSLVLTNNTYINQQTSLPKGQDITFTGTTPSFSTPYTFSTTYYFDSEANLTTPLAELILSGSPSNGGELFSGRFIGYSDPNLPKSLLGAAVVEFLDSSGSASFTIGTGPNTTAFQVLGDTSAAPLPSSAWMGVGLLGIFSVGRVLRRCSSQCGPM